MVAPSEIVGDFELMDTIGSGGFGAVWAARSQIDGDVVAIKILHPELLHHRVAKSGPTVADRFLAEARLLQKLDHPGFVKIKAVIHEPRRSLVAYAMERLIGADLAKRKTVLSLSSLLEVFARVSDTLEFLHGKEIIHRDVKLSNIFVTDPRKGDRSLFGVKLLDFGVAKELHAQAVLANTATGTFMGSVRCMAPESFYRWEVGGAPLSGSIDQWAMGVAMYECFTGKMPFDDDSMVGLITKIETTPPNPMVMHPRFGLERVPTELESLVMCCLEKKPDDRFDSMGALARVLRHITNQIPGIPDEITDTGLDDSTVMDDDSAPMPVIPGDGPTEFAIAAVRTTASFQSGAPPGRKPLDRDATVPEGRTDTLSDSYEADVQTAPEAEGLFTHAPIRRDSVSPTVSTGSPSGQFSATDLRPVLRSDEIDATVVDQTVETSDRTLLDPATSPKLVVGVPATELGDAIPEARIGSLDMDRALNNAPANRPAKAQKPAPVPPPQRAEVPKWLPLALLGVVAVALGIGVFIGWLLRGS